MSDSPDLFTDSENKLLAREGSDIPSKLKIEEEPLLKTVSINDADNDSLPAKKKRRLSAKLFGAFRLSNRLSGKQRSLSKSSNASFESNGKKRRLSARISGLFRKRGKSGANSLGPEAIEKLEIESVEQKTFKPKSNRTSLGRRLSGMFSKKILKSSSKLETMNPKFEQRQPVESLTLQKLEDSGDTRAVSPEREGLPSVLLGKEHNLKLKKMRDEKLAQKKMKFISPLDSKKTQLEELSPTKKKKSSGHKSQPSADNPLASIVNALLTPTTEQVQPRSDKVSMTPLIEVETKKVSDPDNLLDKTYKAEKPIANNKRNGEKRRKKHRHGKAREETHSNEKKSNIKPVKSRNGFESNNNKTPIRTVKSKNSSSSKDNVTNIKKVKSRNGLQENNSFIRPVNSRNGREDKNKILPPGRVKRKKRNVGRLKGLKKADEGGDHRNTLYRIFAKMNEKEKALLTPSNAKKRETLL